ncbi:MAG: hypothetical protein ABFD69_10225, partial [Candidatus Sumerlaeia bacterium]
MQIADDFPHTEGTENQRTWRGEPLPNNKTEMRVTKNTKNHENLFLSQRGRVRQRCREILEDRNEQK